MEATRQRSVLNNTQERRGTLSKKNENGYGDNHYLALAVLLYCLEPSL